MNNIPVAAMNLSSHGQINVSISSNSLVASSQEGAIGNQRVRDGPPPMVRINPLLTSSYLNPSPGDKVGGSLVVPPHIFFHGGDIRPPRNRKPNYSENEKQIFYALISPHVEVLDAKSQERQIMTMKTEIWKEITHKYNEIITKLNANYVCRDSEELKTFWKNVRRSNRRKFSVEGHGMYFCMHCLRWEDCILVLGFYILL